MKNDDREQVTQICATEDKKEEEVFLRTLWRECFCDSVPYEDFYFHNIYRKNIVYCVRDKGMLHLNPYLCKIDGREQLLYYIVGVATRNSERRKGIMRMLLNQALKDLYESNMPFTYLMPANVKYYESFDFVSIFQRKEEILKRESSQIAVETDEWKQEEKNPVNLKKIQFIDYDTLLKKHPDPDWLFQKMDRILTGQYDLYAKHDKAYFDLLLNEKSCQDGNVIFCFEEEIKEEYFRGFFAYSREKDILVVEQYVMKQISIEDCMRLFTKEPVTIVHQFPYMIRVVQVETFLKMFARLFRQYANKRIWITDGILPGNNGIYTLSFLKEEQVRVTRQKVTEQMDESMWDEKMTVEDLGNVIFTEQSDIREKVFFAEVV